MSDSIDRVFSHALNTVNKIRTGSHKPPANVRLRLYGLYKQSMEGDVEGIMEKPKGTDEPSRRAREKWDAWHAQAGLSRTEAKRRYITTLIETMNKYASASNESRELVSELEFVWQQVASNVPSSNSSSPMQASGIPLDVSRHGAPPKFGDYSKTNRSRHQSPDGGDDSGMHVVSPVSKDQLELEAAGDAEEEDEFVDAPDSQAEDAQRQRNIGAVLSSPSRGGGLDRDAPLGEERRRKRRSYPPPAPPPSGDEKWKKSMSASVIKLTAELAAVREQLEARRLFTHTIQFRIFRFITRSIWGIVKHIAVDIFLLGIILLWLRRKNDERLKNALRILLGDSVVRIGDKQLSKLQLPLLSPIARKPSG